MKTACPIFMLMLSFFLVGYTSLKNDDKKLRKKHVPDAVKKAMANKYPDARNVHYYREKKGDTLLYEVAFRSGKDKYELLFTENGEIFELEVMLELDEIPLPARTKILEELDKQFYHYKIKSCQQVNPHHLLNYELTIKGRHVKENHLATHGFFELFFTQKGEFIKLNEKKLKPIITQF